jgi:hypothetical protein
VRELRSVGHLLWLLMLFSCSSGGSMVTMQAFYEIPVGTSVSEVIATAGQPYAIHEKEDGSVEYEYIERFKVGSRYTEDRHLFLLIKDGKVVSKRVQQGSPAPYTFDSYDMQTTQTGI